MAKKRSKTISTANMMKESKSITKVNGSVTLFTISKEELNKISNTGNNPYDVGHGVQGKIGNAKNREIRKENKKDCSKYKNIYNNSKGKNFSCDY